MRQLRQKVVKVVAPALWWCLLIGCIDPYSPPITKNETELLVIDAFLTNAPAMTNVRLSYTASLDPGDIPKVESGAFVRVESEDGIVFDLFDQGDGNYSNLISLDPTKKYRLTLSTTKGKSFVSDYVDVKLAPPIDSVTWKAEDSDFKVQVTTHDDTKATRYYLWSYEVTWRYHSEFFATIKYDAGRILQRTPDEFIYECWKTAPSTVVLIGSSEQLQEDIISNLVLITEPINSEKLRLEYSVLVRQYALTPDAYKYWEELKKNNEDMGTLFGNLPSQNLTNFHCTSHPGEPVIGYLSAGVPQEKRLFVKEKQIPRVFHESGYVGCEADTLFLDQLPFYTGASELISEAFIGPAFIGYMTSSNYCVDCRARGGTTTRPDYWE